MIKSKWFETRQARCVLVAFASLLALTGCTSLPENVERPTSYAYTDTDSTRLGQSRREEIRHHAGDSGFLLLGNGLDAFVARAVLASAADRSIDAQYYLLHNDLTGKLFIDQLVKAADRGVRVRLLVDDMDLGGRTLGAAVLDNHPNVEVRLFNPFSRDSGRIIQLLTRFGSVTRRMHNKSFTVDNQAAILGGRNIGDEYFDADPELVFTDMDVLVIGPVVKEVSASFDRYWNSELAYPATALLEREPSAEESRGRREALDRRSWPSKRTRPICGPCGSSDLAKKIRADEVRYEWGDAHVVQDAPEKVLADRSEKSYHLAPQLSPYFEGVKQELYIFSPYFVPGKEGTAFLGDLSQRGVRVRVSHQLPGLNGRAGGAFRLRQVPQGSAARRCRALRDEAPARKAQEAQRVGLRRIVQGQPPFQGLHLRPRAHLYWISQPGSQIGAREHRDRCGADLTGTRWPNRSAVG